MAASPDQLEAIEFARIHRAATWKKREPASVEPEGMARRATAWSWRRRAYRSGSGDGAREAAHRAPREHSNDHEADRGPNEPIEQSIDPARITWARTASPPGLLIPSLNVDHRPSVE